MAAQSVSFASNIVVSLFWTDFKSILQSKNTTLQYITGAISYTIFCIDDLVVYTCTVWTGTVPDDIISSGYSQAQNNSDLSDFQTNWQPSANGQASSTIATGSLGALNATVQISMSALQSVGVQISAGTFIGIIVAEISFDNGTTWNQTYFSQVGSGNKLAVISYASANSALACSFVMNGGVGLARLRVFSYTSGSCNVVLRASNISDESLVLFTATPGTTNPPGLAIIGGSVTAAAPSYTTGLANAMSLNTSGGLRVDGSGVTQPVSGTVTANQGTANATPWLTTISQGGNSTTVKAASTAAVAADPAVVVAISPNNTVAATAPTLTKGTQGANGWSTQDLKDSGRVIKTYVATATAGVTSEGLLTLTPYADLAAGSTGTSFAVTAGKRLRLQSIVVTWRNNTAAAGGVTIRFRTNSNGTAIVSSPVQFAVNATTSLATIGSGATNTLIFPDGFELSGTMQFALTQIAVGAVVGLDVSCIGYEY
jgi:hypothetical protein